ncbi:hypothetical protein A2T76_10885 [Pseudomonas brenneri]|nr:hypothetical protein A2T76_10885 [Pseudomonas brenneri]
MDGGSCGGEKRNSAGPRAGFPPDWRCRLEFSSSNHLFFTALRPVCMQGSMILLVWLLVMIAGAW